MIARCLTLYLLLLFSNVYADTISFGSGDDAFEIEFVEIGSPGNPPDPASNHMIGDVAYTYHISKHEISREMMEAVGLERYMDPFRAFSPVLGDYPATGMEWSVAAAFTNRLNQAVESPVAYKGSTPRGTGRLWEPGEIGYNADNPIRNRLAQFAIPTSDELYKAGFYDPSANGGTGGYWVFATGSNEVPTPVGSGVEPNTDVYGQDGWSPPATIDSAGGLSPFGVMAVGGNAAEWEESAWDGTRESSGEDVGVRGGNWLGPERGIKAGERFRTSMDEASALIGFRVVMLTPPDFDLGDVNTDGLINAHDINRMALAIRELWTGREFDLNGDSDVTDLDRQFLIDEILDVSFGDTNLDGAVDFEDFLALSSRYGKSGGWESGDSDGDGRVAFADFLALSSNYASSEATASVPEPTFGGSLLFLSLAFIRCCHRKR